MSKVNFPKGTIIVAAAAVMTLVIALAAYAMLGQVLVAGYTLPSRNIPGTSPVGVTSPVPATTLHAAGPMPGLNTTTAAVTTEVPVIIIRNDRFGDEYELAYSFARNFSYGEKFVRGVGIERPPLYIIFNVTPSMVKREKIEDIGLSTEHNVTALYPDPRAWFEVDVIDEATGDVIERRGFGREFSGMTQQEFMVRAAGEYRIVSSGNRVAAQVTILRGSD
jgi:hypothetical protein